MNQPAGSQTIIPDLAVACSCPYTVHYIVMQFYLCWSKIFFYAGFFRSACEAFCEDARFRQGTYDSKFEMRYQVTINVCIVLGYIC